MFLVSVTSLRKAFPLPGGGERLVIDIPSFALDAGEQVALHGESGGGKSTFLHLLAGLLVPDSGSIRIDGDELTALGETQRDRFRARNVGFLHQTFNLLQGCTALENVLLGMAFGRGPDELTAEAALRRVGLQDYCGHYPRQLSVGQQQRVALARALAGRPRLVLADEPTASLDRRNAAEAVALLRSLCSESGATLVLVSHDFDVIRSFGGGLDFSAVNQAASTCAPGVPAAS